MLVLEKIAKYKNSPVCIIFNGASVLGVELSKLLIEQRAFVILIDEYTEKKKARVSEVLDEELFSFVDISGTDTFVEQLPKVDYVFYLNHEGNDPYADVSTSKFLEKSNQLDKLLQLATEKEAKFLLTSSVKIHKALQSKKDVSSDFDLEDESLSYTVLEVQRYAENLTWEYHKKGDLDARILRVGELLGEGIDLDRNTLMYRFIRSAISGTKIDIEGDGLENLYLVHVKDAAYGLIKGLFTSKTNGNVYSLYIPRDITTLNLAYKILDLEPRAEGINFVDKDEKSEMNVYKPAQNIKSIGWKPKISFERALASTIDYAYKVFGKKRQVTSAQKQGEKLVKMKRDKSRKTGGKKRRSLKEFFTNFFFEVKEEKRPKSVLDSMQYKSTSQNVEKGKNVFLTDRKRKGVNQKAKKTKRKLKIVNPFKGLVASIKALTLAQFILYALLAGVLLVIYLFLLVPSVRILFYSTKAYIYIGRAEDSFEEYEFSATSDSLDVAYDSLVSVNEDVGKLSYLSVLGVGEKIDSIQGKVSGLQESIGASRLVFQELAVLEVHLESYKSNVVLEGTDQLKAEDSLNYDLASFDGLQLEMENLSNEFLRTENIFDEKDYELSLIGGYVEKLANRNLKIREFAKPASEILKVVPLLLATEDEQTYAILLLDDSDLNTRGGTIVSVAVLSVLEGAVSDVSIYSPSEFSIQLSSQEDKFVRDDLKLLYKENDFSFEDLTMLFDDDVFIALLNKSLESVSGKKPDHIVTLNMSAFSDLLPNIGSINMSDSTTLTASDLEGDLEGFLYKEFTAKLLENLIRFDKGKAISLSAFLQKSLKNKSVVLYSTNENYENCLESLDILEDENSAEYLLLDPVFFLRKGELPQVEVEVNLSARDHDASVEYKFDLVAAEEEGYEGQLVLQNITSFQMEEVTSSTDEIDLSSSYADKIFINIKLEAGSEETVTISGSVSGLVAKQDNLYNAKLFMKKPLGYVYYSDFTVDLGADSVVVGYPEGFLKQDSVFTFSEYITQDEVFEFTYRNEE